MTTISQLRADLDAADTMSAEASEDHLMTEEISLRHWNACNDYVAALRAPLLAEIERLNIRYFEGPTRLVNRKNAYRYIADHDAAKARLDLMNAAGPSFYGACEYAEAAAEEEHAERLMWIAWRLYREQSKAREAIAQARRGGVAVKRTMAQPDGYRKTGKTVRGADGVRVPVVEVTR